MRAGITLEIFTMLLQPTFMKEQRVSVVQTVGFKNVKSTDSQHWILMCPLIVHEPTVKLVHGCTQIFAHSVPVWPPDKCQRDACNSGSFGQVFVHQSERSVLFHCSMPYVTATAAAICNHMCPTHWVAVHLEPDMGWSVLGHHADASISDIARCLYYCAPQ